MSSAEPKEQRKKENQDDPAWLQIIQRRLLSRSLAERLNRLAEGCAVRAGLDAAAISVMGNRQVIVVGSHGCPRDSQDRNRSLLALAADSSFPVFIPDISASADCAQRAIPGGRQPAALYSLPIIVENELPIGSISGFCWERRAANAHEPLADMDAFAEAARSIFSHRMSEEFDADTHCMTASHFAEVLERQWREAARSQREPTLLVISLPSLMAINKRYGREEGDRLIAHVAETLRRRVLIQNGVVSRITGSSFAVLMQRRVSGSLLEAIGQGIRSAVDVHGASPSVAIAGISLPARRWPGFVPDGNLLITAADRATAKRSDARNPSPPIWSIEHLREFAELKDPTVNSDAA